LADNLQGIETDRPLIGGGGKIVTVGENNITGRQTRSDYLFHMLPAVAEKEVEFLLVGDLLPAHEQIPDLPRQDVLALGLIAAIVVVGFILEGMRIAMTGFPEGSCYAFLGYAIGRLFFSASSLVNVYGFIWYLHAILTGAFIAYLPFSKLLHIIVSPLVLMGNAVSRKEERQRHIGT